MDDTEKAIRERLAGYDTDSEEVARAASDVHPGSLVLAPFRLVRILDTERETIAALRRELASVRDASDRQAQELRACAMEAQEAAERHHRELAARTEERDAALKALEPFAVMWRQFAKDRPLQPSGDTAFYSAMKIPGAPAAELTPNHLLAAARALGDS